MKVDGDAPVRLVDQVVSPVALPATATADAAELLLTIALKIRKLVLEDLLEATLAQSLEMTLPVAIDRVKRIANCERDLGALDVERDGVQVFNGARVSYAGADPDLL